tara:strand:+ start:350 stop:538 length:189 start_codon:yes stop_codon:yes gene_type:complete
MNFDLTMEDHTIILNALHYYKKVEKRGNFQQYDDQRINELRDKLAHQLIWNNTDIDKFVNKE